MLGQQRRLIRVHARCCRAELLRRGPEMLAKLRSDGSADAGFTFCDFAAVHVVDALSVEGFLPAAQYAAARAGRSPPAGVPPPQDSFSFYKRVFEYVHAHGGVGYEVDFMSNLFIDIPGILDQ